MDEPLFVLWIARLFRGTAGRGSMKIRNALIPIIAGYTM